MGRAIVTLIHNEPVIERDNQAQPRLSSCLITWILMVFCVTFARAQAATVAINFDDLPNNFVVGAEYANRGVFFRDARTSDLRSLDGGSFPMGIVSDSRRYNPQPSSPISAVFVSAVNSVSLTGLDVGENGFTMTAFDAADGGAVVATDTVYGSDTGIGQYFTLTLVGENIFRVEFSQARYTHPLHEGAGWDDLVFDVSHAAHVLGAVILHDVNTDGVGELAILRDQPIRVEVRSGADGALVAEIPFLDMSVEPLVVKALADSDGNGVAEIAVLARRKSDGRGVVEMRNVTGAPATRQVWFGADQRPVAMATIDDDADNNGVTELAVLSRRTTDSRGLVEVKNAYGPTNPHAIWVGAGLRPLDLDVVPDTDGDGVSEIAVLSRRNSDGRIVIEVKNAAGPTNPSAVWFMAGNTAIDLAVVADKDGNGIPEVAVLSKRDSDGRMVTEVKNARGPTNPSAVWFAAGHTGLALEALGDADSNAVPEIAVLSRRNSDGRILVEVKNAALATNPRSLWYPAGHKALDLAILNDVDGNGIEEAAVLMTRDSDGRILVQRRNGAGLQAPTDYWFSPLQLPPPSPPEYAETEYNDERAFADTFYLNSTAVGSLANAYDVDWFTINIDQQITAKVTFDVTSASSGWWNVYWYDKDMNVLSGRNIIASSAVFEYQFPAFSPGAYYMRIQPTDPALYSGSVYKVTVAPAP